MSGLHEIHELFKHETNDFHPYFVFVHNILLKPT